MKNNELVHGGLVLPCGEVINLAVGIVGSRSGAQRTPEGVYLLEDGEQFSLRLINVCNFRDALMRITGDSDSTVIADSLVLAATKEATLSRWQTVDQAFVAHKRDSAAGAAAGAAAVTEGGGGLIRVVFTVGKKKEPQRHLLLTAAVVYRSGQSFGMNERSSPSIEEGVMGAGGTTGQQFGTTTFEADPDVSQVEIQIRWAIKGIQPPPDRVVVKAPSVT